MRDGRRDPARNAVGGGKFERVWDCWSCTSTVTGMTVVSNDLLNPDTVAGQHACCMFYMSQHLDIKCYLTP